MMRMVLIIYFSVSFVCSSSSCLLFFFSRRFQLELPSGNLAARAHAGMEGNVDQMRKGELMKYARSLGVATRREGTKNGVQSERCVKTARLGRRLSRSVLEHTQVSQALPALAWRCGQLHVGPHLRRP